VRRYAGCSQKQKKKKPLRAVSARCSPTRVYPERWSDKRPGVSRDDLANRAVCRCRSGQDDPWSKGTDGGERRLRRRVARCERECEVRWRRIGGRLHSEAGLPGSAICRDLEIKNATIFSSFATVAFCAILLRNRRDFLRF